MSDSEPIPTRKNTIEATFEAASQGHMFDAFASWFKLEKDSRNRALKEAVKSASEINEELRPALNRCSDPNIKFLLKNFAVLTNKAAETLFNPPVDRKITAEDIADAEENRAGSVAYNALDAFATELDVDFYAELDDFVSPEQTVQRFSLEDMEKFMLSILPHIDLDSKISLVGFNRFTHPLKHAEILLNPEIRSQLPESTFALYRDTLGWLENVLTQDLYPSMGLLTLFFEADPEGRAAGTTVQREGKQIPMSVYYFTRLRRAVQMTESENPDPRDWSIKTPTDLKILKDRLVDYLLDDDYMERALPYIQGGVVYDDIFMKPAAGGILYVQAETKDLGEEGNKILGLRFGEVLRVIGKHLEEKGDYDALRKLKSREVAGVKFADFWSKV